MWRKATIADAGGWEADTLTEDLDLSYRAQLKGWKFQYLENKVSPAELPAEMNAIKSQQFRWSKGAAECVRKNLRMVMQEKSVKWSTKVHAFFHLMNSFNYISLLLSGILLIPLMYMFSDLEEAGVLLGFMSIYQVSFFLLYAFYVTANAQVSLKSVQDYLKFSLHYPFFLSVSMGISLYNAIGVIEGYLGKKSDFIRTPKFNIVRKNGSWDGKDYVKREVTLVTWLEFACFLLFSFGLGSAIYLNNVGAIPYFMMMTCGFGAVLYYSYWHFEKAKSLQQEPLEGEVEMKQVIDI
ncbi:MAG: glycosyltransferase family 2 protein [Flammeovirgaceae bacterium]